MRRNAAFQGKHLHTRVGTASRSGAKEGSLTPPRAIALWGLGPLHEQIARSRERGLVGHALGAKRVARGPLSRCRYGV
jgi:hypothetical protein